VLNKNLTASFKLGASAVALMAVIGASGAAYAQDSLETVVVTGFRQSLEKAMDVKRTSVEASDAIMAEDIGKFPDMNVSESLQRIPGVNITRESGEGRQVAVRGLGAQFTRVRINGMETTATVGGPDISTSGGGSNRNRSFDFNVFASDLFTQLKVHKSNSATVEEGSLGATVDLTTGRPFDLNGRVLSLSAQYGYQEMAGSSNPRFAALASDTFFGGKLGVLVSAAYGITNTLEEGVSTVRWMNDTNTGTSGSASNRYRQVCTDAGVTCVNGTNATYLEANAAFRPRFPRYEIYKNHTERLGMTGSVQWQPGENTLFTLDALFANFHQKRQEFQLEANSFSTGSTGAGGSYVDTATSSTMYYRSLGVGNISLINYASSNIGGGTGIDQSGNDTTTLMKANATGVGLRNEHRLDRDDTRYMQVTLDGSHSFTNKFKVHSMLGWTESHYRNPYQKYLMADYGCFGTTNYNSGSNSLGCGAGTNTDPYVYDFSQGKVPLLSTGNVDPTSTAGWFLANVRARENYVNNSFRSAELDATYDLNRGLKVTAGASARFYGFNTLEKRRGVDTSTSEDASLSAAVRSVALSTYASSIGFKSIEAPSGSDTKWFTLDHGAAATAIHLDDPTVFPMSFAPGYSNSGTVHENDYATWVQLDWDTDILGLPFRGNVGTRYVLTEMRSLGYQLQTGNPTPVGIEGHNVYHDWLPALNAVLEPVDNFLVRFNASLAMSRPGLQNMMPTGTVSVTGSGAAANLQNPELKPTRSKNLDLAFEYYYGGSMISVAGFWKHIDTFIQSVQTPGVWSDNPFGLTEEAFVAACGGTGKDWSTVTQLYCTSNGRALTPWTFTAPVNAKGAPLWGTEINWQQQFNFLPAPFDNMGLLANYTYVQAQQSYYNANGSLIMKADLVNLSRTSYNTTLYYDDTVFQARVTGAYRGRYLVNSNIGSNNNNYGIWSKATFNLDAQVSYKYNENFLFFVNGMNLTDQATDIVADRFAERSYVYHKTGRVFYIGVKYTH
jgi:TonB-dependent receptor